MLHTIFKTFAQISLWCFVVYTLLLSTAVTAQTDDFKFESLTVEQGLSFSLVNAILQDKKGFMWFGTADGLNKFDGYTFTTYRHDRLDSNSIFGNWVMAIHEDTYGLLWIVAGGQLDRFNRSTEVFTHCLRGDWITAICEDTAADSRRGTMWFATSGGGLHEFDRATGTFKRYKHDAANANSISHDSLLCLYVDRSGMLWIGTADGLNSLDPTTQIVTRYNKGPTNHVNVVYEDFAEYGSTLWIGTDDGLYTFDRKSEMFTRCQGDPQNSKGKSWNDIRTMHCDQTGILWIGTGAGLAEINRSNRTLKSYQNVESPLQKIGAIKSIVEDRRGALWLLGDGSQSAKFDRSRKTYTIIRPDPNNPQVGFALHSLYKDRSGTIWLGTTSYGVLKIDGTRKAFTYFTNDRGNPNSLSHRAVAGIVEDSSGVLWVATASGLNKFNKGAGTFTRYGVVPGDSRSLPDPTVWPILEDRNGTLWLGTRGGGFERFDHSRNSVKDYTHDPSNANSLSNNAVTSLYESKSGKLWVGMSPGGLDEFDSHTETFEHYVHDPHNPSTLSPWGVLALHEDADGILWVGTEGGGLNKFDRGTGKFFHYVNDPKRLNSLSHNVVRAIHEDRNGVLWIGTNAGLNRFDKTTETFTAYTVKDGLANDHICGILEDESCLWLSTGKGILRFDPRTGAVRNYDAGDGVNCGQCFAPTGYKNSRGEMFFGAIYGLVSFHPDSLRDNPLVPPIVLTAFKKFDKPAPLDSAISEKKTIELSYKDNVISFEFAALNYSHPEKNQYAYKLEGFDQDWIYCGTRRTATYTNLDGGDYIFRVKGSNNDGVWNEDGTSIAVIITPPFWKTWWFRSVFGVLLLGSVGGSIRYVEMKKLKRKIEQLEQERALERERARISQDMHDEVGASLTEIAILSELAKKGAQGGSVPGSQIEKISEKSRELIDNISEIIWAINPKNDQLDGNRMPL